MSPFQSQPPTPEGHNLTTAVIAVASTLGATGLAMLLKVWLENRRLTNKDYRKTLVERIAELEKRLGELYDENSAQREKIGRLEAEVSFLKGEPRESGSDT